MIRVLAMQKTLVLLGSALYAMTQEQREIAWARLILELKSLAKEEYKDRDSACSGQRCRGLSQCEWQQAIWYIQAERAHQAPKGGEMRTYEIFYPGVLPCVTTTGSDALSSCTLTRLFMISKDQPQFLPRGQRANMPHYRFPSPPLYWSHPVVGRI